MWECGDVGMWDVGCGMSCERGANQCFFENRGQLLLQPFHLSLFHKISFKNCGRMSASGTGCSHQEWKQYSFSLFSLPPDSNPRSDPQIPHSRSDGRRPSRARGPPDSANADHFRVQPSGHALCARAAGEFARTPDARAGVYGWVVGCVFRVLVGVFFLLEARGWCRFLCVGWFFELNGTMRIRNGQLSYLPKTTRQFHSFPHPETKPRTLASISDGFSPCIQKRKHMRNQTNIFIF